MTEPSAPRHTGIFDAAVSDPDSDLLGISLYARRLAEFVAGLQPPFTIGVYGAWGSGKTTFVRFVEAMLQQRVDPLKFINFEAWPFRTSDDLWRALVQAIARELYDVTDESQTPAPDDDVPPPLPVRISSLLTRPAFRLGREARTRDPNKGYYDLLRRLDENFYGGVRHPTSEGRLLDEEGALAALLQGAVATLGSLSPLIAAMRGLFGESKVDIAKLLKEEKDETTRRRIRSVDEFRKVLRDLFETRAAGVRVCVFIDDLDRCMPDVALDLLEALKIFLGETRCIFIVAADEQLIGEGLRLRYKELLEIAPVEESARLFARRGKEYFEKIIQLGIRVPDHSPNEVHKFISAQFPQWHAATDLIQAAIGTNPRRLKQYCTWLTYKSMVARETEENEADDGRQLLNKLIELRSWSPGVVAGLRRIACEDDCAAILQRLETCLRQSTPDVKRPTADEETAHPLALKVYEEAVMSTPLYRLFTSHPLLSNADPLEIAAMASFVDVVPATESSIMLRSSDPVMMRILDKIAVTGNLAPRQLLIEDLTKLFTLAAHDATVTELLTALAGSEAWAEHLQSVEEVLKGGTTAPTLTEPAALTVVELARKNEQLRQDILASPLLSNMLPHVVREWHAVKPETFTEPKPAERASSAEAKIPPARRERIEHGLALRISAAHHFIQLRKFVKLDSLDYAWPEVAQHLRKDFAGVRSFESNVVDPDQRPEDLPPLWRQHLKDDQLTAFFRLRPYLRDFYADELKKYLKLSESVVTSGEGTPRPSGLPEITAAVGPYISAELRIVAGAKPGSYDVTLTAPGREPATDTVVMEQLQYIVRPPLEVASMITREAASSEGAAFMRGQELAARLREVGSQLYATFLRGTVDAMMMDLLRDPSRRRFLLNLPTELMQFPWEALYALPLKLFVGLTSRYSLVRVVPPPIVPRLRPFVPPLRIVAVLASPEGESPLQIKQESELLQRTLSPAIERGMVTFDMLLGPDATKSETQRMLRIRRPHIFHFSGHGTFLNESEGALLFEGPPGSRAVSASDVATLLRDNDVLLAVLSGCDTGHASSEDASTGVAGALAYAGIPAVIGAMRPILDDSALLFARELYRAIVDGYPIEESLIEARKAQSLERWDWPAFALFSSGSVLDDLRIELPRA